VAAQSVWFTAPRRAEVRPEDVPRVEAGQVRIQALASAISHGTEMLVYRGQVPADLELDLPTLRGGWSFPIKYGYASVGRVVEAPGVEQFEPGDAVFALHPHQSEYVVPSSMAVKLPPGLNPLLGVFLANTETAVNIALDAAPRLGERVAIFGQGVVGLLVTQLLKRTGVSLLAVVDPIQSRRTLASQFGAHLALAPETCGDALRTATDGNGVDIAIEVSGNAAALNQAIDSLAFGGSVLVCSWYGTKPAQVVLGGAFHRRRLRLVSSQVGTIEGALQPRWTHARRLALARDLLPTLSLEPLISHRFPLAGAPDAYRLIDERPEEVTQVVLTY
jgi:2-desacetyl-2-hydroxyethyl bacteriochlorophyllide A dehydrogenase